MKIKSKNSITFMVSMGLQGKNGEISKYHVFISHPEGHKPVEIDNPGLLNSQPAQFPNLRAYTEYVFYAQAETSAGKGPRSEEQRVRTEPDLPEKPEGLGFDENDPTLRIHWSPPEFPNGVISNYTVRILLRNGSEFDLIARTDQMKMFNTKTPTSEVFKFYVWARNSVGRSRQRASFHLDNYKPQETSDSQITTLVVVMIVVAIFLFLVIIVILGVFYRKRR